MKKIKRRAHPIKGTVKHIAFTLYLVKDISRARRFYENSLGLKPTKNYKDQWIEYHLGNGCFAIATMGKGKGPRSSSSQIAFEVDDVDAVVKRLRANGAVVKMEPNSGSVCRMADLLDTEGNPLTIHAKHR